MLFKDICICGNYKRKCENDYNNMQSSAYTEVEKRIKSKRNIQRVSYITAMYIQPFLAMLLEKL